jgi:alpha-tubulin suppressor-like RCC1 family protein
MWGTINFKGSNLFKQAQPQLQPAQNIYSISCGNSHVVAIDTYGDAFVIGSNEFGQLGLEGERHTKAFKKINSRFIG